MAISTQDERDSHSSYQMEPASQDGQPSQPSLLNLMSRSLGILAQLDISLRPTRLYQPLKHSSHRGHQSDMSYTTVDKTEQRLISMWRKRGMSCGEIAGLLERSRGTISRQVKKIAKKSHRKIGRPRALTDKDVEHLMRVNAKLVRKANLRYPVPLVKQVCLGLHCDVLWLNQVFAICLGQVPKQVR